MTRFEIIHTLRQVEDYHTRQSDKHENREEHSDADQHSYYADAVKAAIDLIGKDKAPSEWLSQALNEGDGTYKP